MIGIRFARMDDIENIVAFLREHWSENNILVKSRRIFDFQYVDGENCGFVLAADDETGRIYGLKGFFPFNHQPRPDIAAALAIVLQGVRPMLGMEIQRFLEKNTNCRWLCSTGLNPDTSVRIYKRFRGYTVDRLKHYYRLADRPAYSVAAVRQKRIRPVPEGGGFLLPDTPEALFAVFDPAAYREQRPYKDEAYLTRRYFEHPVYRYRMLGIRSQDSEGADGVYIAREVECNGARVLRIVDYIGDRRAIARAGGALERYVRARDAEYADFYCYGFDHEALEAGGFVLRDENDPNVVPNYFEPFEQRNIDIHFFSTGDENAAVCRADGDQDRPSILPEGFADE